MSRLRSRSGLRVLSILILVLGLVGGGVLHADRQAQQRASVAAARARIDADYHRQLVARQQAAATAAAPTLTAIAAAQVLAGRDAAAAAAAASATAKAAQAAARQAAGSTANRSDGSYGPVPSSCKVYTGNREIGCTLLASFGFGLDQMDCLDKMWTRESNWRTTAENKSSGAYGIPQALPGNKMATVESDWRTNPVTQIRWGLGYIKGRSQYKTPCGAWTFWQAHNFY